LLSVLKRNLPLKIFSVLLAVFLWSVISRGVGGERMEMSLGVPVELHNLPADMEVVKGPAERINVRFSGPRRIVSKVSQLGLTIPIDLEGAAEGETTFEIFTADLSVPEKITVTRVSPSNLGVTLEKTIRSRVPIEVVFQGRPGKGFQTGTPTVNPPTVDIKGPRTKVSKIRKVQTAAIIIDGETDNIVREVTLISPSDRVRILDRNTARVRIPIVSDD